ncbi:ABC transporter ATP-binding protein [Rhizocola hellebori]|uniref:ABC transporter ATP-binding protein n=1 Tax=Rhizocola hellebori TaxID=1392758 RepID=A0A8J3QEQ1_9ACTN|nr:ABC transporter ATP-binding protein [Rhizocola hellebori]GIH09513.1 ABC transporter ATP-binding protein [Rhizocola hellebori]
MVVVEQLRRVYGHGHSAVVALDEVSCAFEAGTFTAVMGPSGSGKSTLLQCAAGLDQPTSGKVRLGETDLGALSENARTKLRRTRFGFVFQAFNLLPALSAAQNVALPLRLAGRKPRPAEVAQALEMVGIADRADHRPSELSGGEQQRVAIARALITGPDVVFADEPTGSLDSATGREVLRLLRAVVDQRAQTVVMVTHDPRAAAYADRVVFLADGRLAGQLERPSADAVAARMTGLEG